MTAEIGNYIANLAIADGGSFVKVHPVTHLTLIRCRENTLKEIRSNENIKMSFNINARRINRWWWSVAFIDKKVGN